MEGCLYCEGFIGAGHLVRTLHLCRELVSDYAITLLHGPMETGITIASERFRAITLSSDPSARRQQLDDVVATPYAFFLTEQYPFGKYSLKNEVLSLIQRMSPSTLIGCSYRGCALRGSNYSTFDSGSHALEPHINQVEKEVLLLLRAHYDQIFVHTDPKVMKLDETFYYAAAVADMVTYTGFVTAPPSVQQGEPRQKEILVINNGTQMGALFLQAIAGQVEQFPDYQWRFATGAYPHSALLGTYLKKALGANVIIEGFLPDVNAALSRCALAITNGGTIVFNHATTATPALVLPDPTLPDQCFLSEKFNGRGGIRVMSLDQLTPATLTTTIRKLLVGGLPTPVTDVDFDGARQMRRALNALVD